jgi:hypothetical protein
VKHFIDTPGYANTEEEAAKLLRVVHLRREETELQKHALEKAVDRCTIQLGIIQPHTDHTRLALRELEAYRSELMLSTESVAEAEGDVGIVRAHLRRKGILIQVTCDRGDTPSWGSTDQIDIGDDSDNDSTVTDEVSSVLSGAGD